MKQKNPVLPFVKNVKIEFRQDITPDYIFGKDMCALYIGVKYHNANPNYLEGRMITLKNMFSLRVLICLVDIVCIRKILEFFSLFKIINVIIIFENGKGRNSTAIIRFESLMP